MEEINYKPIETSLGNSQDNKNSSLLMNNYNNINSKMSSEENISYSQSDQDIEIIDILQENKKEDEQFENNKINDKLCINIDTLQSLRISHSFEKSKNSKSLIDILNGGNYHFDENENENESNTSNNNNENDKNIINLNKDSNYNQKFSNTNNKNTSAMTKNSIYYNKRNSNQSNTNNNNNKYNYTSAFELNNANNNNKSKENKNDNIKTINNNMKIEDVFREIFEAKIKPKSNKLNGEKNSEVNINNILAHLKQRTLEQRNKINSLLNHSAKTNVNKNQLDSSFNSRDDKKNDELVFGMFDEHPDSFEDDDKNIVVSELDIELSDSF